MMIANMTPIEYEEYLETLRNEARKRWEELSHVLAQAYEDEFVKPVIVEVE